MVGGGIAIVLSGFPRRSETFALNEIAALDAAGVVAGVFATKHGEEACQPGARALSSRVVHLAAGSPEEQAREIAGHLGSRRVRAVHGYFAHVPAEVAQHAADELDVPFGFSAHAKDLRKVAPSTLAARARAARCVVTCNSDAAADLRRLGRDPLLVPHGVDLARFTQTPEPPAPALRLLSVGRLVEKKGFATLLDAVASMAAPVELTIVGDGPERPTLDAHVSRLGITERVCLAGPTTHDELPSLLAACHAVVVPSVVDSTGDRDGLPNVVLEAMASGRTVVASRIAAIDAAVDDGTTGLLVPPGDAPALARALDDLAERPEKMARLGRSARRRAERDFDLASCTARLVSTLEEAYA